MLRVCRAPRLSVLSRSASSLRHLRRLSSAGTKLEDAAAAGHATESTASFTPPPLPPPPPPPTPPPPSAFRDASADTDCRAEDSEFTHFGFETVDRTAKTDKVKNVFYEVAERYDVMNDFMSAGLHRVWKDDFISTLDPLPGMKLLDLAGGTGDIAFRFATAAQSAGAGADSGTEVTLCDINESMLEVGERRAGERGFTRGPVAMDFVVADAEKLPFDDGVFDAVTISFGIRNVTRIPRALREAHRVLKRGGRFMSLEFSEVNPEPLRKLYDAYSFNVIPAVGEVVAGQRQPYEYLVESIRRFPNAPTFASMLTEAGFCEVTYRPLTFGVVAIHSGYKL